MNNIEILIAHIKNKIQEINIKRYTLLNNITYIDNLSRQLFSGNINDIDISILESIIKKIGIEEDDIFLEIRNVLEELSMNKEQEIEFILSSFRQLQELSKYKNELEPQKIEIFTNVLAKIVESLYDKELRKIYNSTEYHQLNKEVQELENILSLINKSNKEVLTTEEKDVIYNYLINSNIKDKTTILVELGKIWIEQTKLTQLIKEESILDIGEELEPEIEIQELEEIQAEQREELIKLTNKKTKEEWDKLIRDAITIIKANNSIEEEQKQVLEKILLRNLNETLEDLNMAKEFIDEFEEISLSSRLMEYLNTSRFETNSIGVDLIINLIPNLGNTSLTDIPTIIDKIIEKFNQYYLSEEELKGIKELIKDTYENYPTLTYITYTDEKMLYLEEKFIEYEGNKEKLLSYDNHNDNILKTTEQCDMFIENTYKKLIKHKLEELSNLLQSNESKGLIKKEGIIKQKEELELWLGKYSKYIIMRDMENPYRSYTIEEIERMDFSDRNAIVFLSGESGRTLYEEGLLSNGLNKNGTFQIDSKKETTEIIKKAVAGGKRIKDPDYYDFNTFVQKSKKTKNRGGASKNDDPVIIFGHELIRLSQRGNPARVTVINFNKMPDINKKKIGISTDNTVVLVIGSHEVNFTNEVPYYSYMRAEAEKYERKIQEIVSLFENPSTPKEKLLKYIANSYGLLAHLIGEQEPPQPDLSNENKRGGKK